MSHSPSLLGLRVLWLCVFLLFPALASAAPSVTIGRFGPGTVDGTAPFNVLGSCADTADQRIDGEDCGEGNGVVRTQDSVSHIWSITADGYDPGAPNLKNVVLEQTITPSTNAVIQFDSLPVACTPKAGGGTTPASAIVDNGSGSWKLTCNLGEFSEGQQKSLTVNVKISGKSWNGSDYTSSQRVYSMADDGVTENATGATYADVGPIKISAQPAYDLVHSINTTHGFYNADTGVRAVKDLNGDGVINAADNEAGYYTYSLIRLAAARKTGIEAINQSIVFKDTFKATALAEKGADFPLEFYVTECRDNPSGWGSEVFGSKSYYPSYDNGSYKYHALNSGTCQLVRDTPADPTSVSFTATLNNVDLSGTHYPTLGFGGVDYSAGPYYAANYRVQFFIPFRSIDMTDGAMDDQGSVYLSSVLSDFDPNGLSGTSNYGTDLEPGYDGAPMNGLRGNNRLGPTEYLLTIRGSFNKRNIKNVNDAVTAYTYTSPSSWHGGDGEMEPEQFYAGWVHYVNNGTKSLENPMSCDVFDNTVQRLTDRGDTGGTAGTYAYVGTYAPNGFDYRNYVVEYGHIDLAGDDPLDRNHDGTKDYDITTGRYHGDWAKARAARCDDGVPVGGWFTDPTQVPGGIDEVNATRVRLTDTAKAAGVAFDPGHEMRFVVPLKIRDKFHSGPYAGQTIPVGTVAANFGGVRADNWKAGGTATALGSWTARNYDASPETGDTDGDRVTISRIKMTLDSESLEPKAIPGNTANTLAGSQIVWKVNTAVQSTLPKPSAAENLQIIDELPPEATYNGSCTNAQAGATPPSLVEYNTDRNGKPKPISLYTSPQADVR